MPLEKLDLPSISSGLLIDVSSYSPDPEIQKIKDLPFDMEPLIELCKAHPIDLLAAFDDDAFDGESGDDIDLFVRFSAGNSAVLSVTVERRLSRIVDREVHLVTEDSLTPHMRARVLKELQPLFET